MGQSLQCTMNALFWRVIAPAQTSPGAARQACVKYRLCFAAKMAAPFRFQAVDDIVRTSSSAQSALVPFTLIQSRVLVAGRSSARRTA